MNFRRSSGGGDASLRLSVSFSRDSGSRVSSCSAWSPKETSGLINWEAGSNSKGGSCPAGGRFSLFVEWYSWDFVSITYFKESFMKWLFSLQGRRRSFAFQPGSLGYPWWRYAFVSLDSLVRPRFQFQTYTRHGKSELNVTLVGRIWPINNLRYLLEVWRCLPPSAPRSTSGIIPRSMPSPSPLKDFNHSKNKTKKHQRILARARQRKMHSLGG